MYCDYLIVSIWPVYWNMHIYTEMTILLNKYTALEVSLNEFHIVLSLNNSGVHVNVFTQRINQH